MDMIKILGSLLASGALSKGSGGDVLGSILGGVLGGASNQQTQSGGMLGDLLGTVLGASNNSGSGGLGDILGSVLAGGNNAPTGSNSSGGLGDLLGAVLGGSNQTNTPQRRRPTTASELEDLLGVGKEDGLGGAGGLGGLLGGALAKYGQQINPGMPNPTSDDDFLPAQTDRHHASDHATLIIRAMINAAKSDGQIDNNEQEKVISQLGDVTQDEIDFVRAEFSAPLNVQRFARSIPQGMEQQIYTISLMAIDLDKNSEAQYLADLSSELGIDPQVVNQLHARFDVPQIFA